MWIALTLLASFIWAICNFVDKRITEHHLPDMPPYYAFSAFGSALFAVGVTIFTGFWLPPWPYSLIVIVGGAGFAGMMWFYLKALKIEEASYVVPLFQMGPIWAALQAYWFLHESLVGWDLVAFVVILLGGLVIATQKFSKELLQLRPAFGLMLVATLFVSAMFVSFKYVLTAFPDQFWSLYALQMWGQSAACALLALWGWKSVYHQNLRQDIQRTMPLFLSNDFISFIAFAAYLWALTLAPVAFVGALGGVQGFFAFLVGWYLTLRGHSVVQETITRPVIIQKLIGITILFAGVALLQLK